MARRKYRGRAFWQEARSRLLVEQHGRCPFCRKPLRDHEEVATHHRRRRLGRPDEDDADANLLLLHGDCHRLVHSHPEASREAGFIVPTWADPLTTPKP